MRLARGTALLACLAVAAPVCAAVEEPGNLRFAEAEVRRDVAFRTALDERGVEQTLTLDIYAPAGDSRRARPAILWIHGGGFKPGNDKRQRYIVALASEFARRGYVSVSVDYRVRRNPREDRSGTLRDAVEDCGAALQWIRENASAYGIDRDRIALAGGSAGGKVAVNLAARESGAPNGRPFAVIDLWGSPEADLRPAISSRFPPTVIVHGTADELVPFAESEALAAELARQGVPFLLHPLKDAPHTPADRMDEIVAVTSAFVADALARRSAEPLVVEVAVKPGQPWVSYPTRTLAQLPAAAKAGSDGPVSRYGGNAARRVRGSGFFRAEKIDGRWWLVDPDGYLFLSKGVVSVNMGKTPGAREALAKQFGSEELWARGTTEMLRELGFNNLGAWSDTPRLRAVDPPLPYTRIWSFMAEYGRKRGGTFQQAGHLGYPKDTIFVFDPEFETFAEEYAKRIAASKDDPWLVGHFSDNELPLKLSALKNYLDLPADDPGHVAALAWLRARRGPNATAASASEEDEQEFLFVVAERYFRIVSGALRKADPNHLYLGPRLHGSALRMPEIFRAAGPYVDVIAVNWYRSWTPDPAAMAMWARESGRPSLITEWYAKGVDSGMGNTSGAGWLVRTQEDRGRFYQNFTLALLESKSCVGWHWFRYADNDPDDTTVDPSNRDANKGLVTNRYQPYGPLTDAMKQINARVYSLIEWFDANTSPASHVRKPPSGGKR